jgi:hypothetical protein
MFFFTFHLHSLHYLDNLKFRETGGIYEVRHCDGLTWHDIHATFHNNRFRYSNNMKVVTSTIWGASVLVLLKGDIYVELFQAAWYKNQVSWRSIQAFKYYKGIT